jgi:hypothetical protein
MKPRTTCTFYMIPQASSKYAHNSKRSWNPNLETLPVLTWTWRWLLFAALNLNEKISGCSRRSDRTIQSRPIPLSTTTQLVTNQSKNFGDFTTLKLFKHNQRSNMKNDSRSIWSHLPLSTSWLHHQGILFTSSLVN